MREHVPGSQGEDCDGTYSTSPDLQESSLQPTATRGVGLNCCVRTMGTYPCPASYVPLDKGWTPNL